MTLGKADILLVCPGQNIRDYFVDRMNGHGLDVHGAADIEQAFELIKWTDYEYVFLDLNVDKVTIGEIASRINQLRPSCEVIDVKGNTKAREDCSPSSKVQNDS